MSNVNSQSPNPDEIDDIASIGRDALNALDRRLALDTCLTGSWVNADIGQLERVDTAAWHGWRMWRWKAN